MNTYGYVGGNPINWLDPFGLKTCISFVSDLLKLWDRNAIIGQLGSDLLSHRTITISNPTKFRPALVAGGQNGAVSRHIYGHSGAYLIFPGGSYGNQVIDYFQRFLPGRSQGESLAEIADDVAGRQVGRTMTYALRERNRREQKAERNGQCGNTTDIRDNLEGDLSTILCIP